jgi:nucleoside-diphosphate-sugar epimerase
VHRFIAQSFAPYRYARQGGPVKTEDDPLDPAPSATARQTFAGMNHLDQAVTGADGIALHYGGFYGDPDALIKAVCKRQYPIIGDGAGVMPFIHLHAAAAAVLALDHDGPALYNITDDEPASQPPAASPNRSRPRPASSRARASQRQRRQPRLAPSPPPG